MYPRGTFAARRASPTPYYNIFKQPLSSVFQKFFKNFFRSIDKNISIKKYWFYLRFYFVARARPRLIDKKISIEAAATMLYR